MEKTEESDGALTFSHKNIKKYICEWTSSHRTSLNTIRRLQTPGRARTPPHNRVGQRKKKWKGIIMRPVPRERAVRRRGSYTLGSPLTGVELSLDGGGALELRRRPQRPACRRQTGE